MYHTHTQLHVHVLNVSLHLYVVHENNEVRV